MEKTFVKLDRKFEHASLTEIVDYLQAEHKIILENKIPEIDKLFEETMEVENKKYIRKMEPLKNIFDFFKTEVRNHFNREEGILFPYVRKMEIYEQKGGDKPHMPFKNLENPISRIEFDHDKLEHELLGRIRVLASDYMMPEDAADVLKSLYSKLHELESLITEHRHIETAVLFPRAIRLELSVMHK
ncbi:MAG: hemerythrin domain-containing protein [Phycisphaerales bacterium]